MQIWYVCLSRQANWHTISQNVPLQSNTNYFFSVYIKLLAMDSGVMWHSAVLQVQLDIEGGNSHYHDYKYIWTHRYN